MQLTINGKLREVEAATSVAAVLDELNLDPTRVVVERNRQILGREKFSGVILEDGDSVEIVQFVGGG